MVLVNLIYHHIIFNNNTKIRDTHLSNQYHLPIINYFQSNQTENNFIFSLFFTISSCLKVTYHVKIRTKTLFFFCALIFSCLFSISILFKFKISCFQRHTYQKHDSFKKTINHQMFNINYHL